MMKSIFILWGTLWLCVSSVASSQETYDSLLGYHYTQGEYIGRYLSLTSLESGYTLEKRSETRPEVPDTCFPPYEACARAYILKDNIIVKRIHQLNDLQHAVYIDSEEKALEFARLRTSMHTYFLFRPVIFFEIYKRTKEESPDTSLYGSCSSSFFDRHGLQELELVKRNGYFEIHRDVLQILWHGAPGYPDVPKIYRITERIYEDGAYTLEKKLLLQDIQHSDIPYQTTLP